MGTICGLVGTAFHICVEYATGFRENNHMIIYFLPLAGIVIVFIYRICGIRHSKGTNLVIGSIRSVEDEIPSRMAPLIFISTVITHLFGGSSGREGAALQIGGQRGTELVSYISEETKFRLEYILLMAFLYFIQQFLLFPFGAENE